MKSIRYIAVPIQCGCDKPGGELAPYAIQYLLTEFPKLRFANLPATKLDPKRRFDDCKEVKFLSAVVDTCKEVRDIVFRALSEGELPLVVGGDHSLGLGSVAGALMHDENLGLIWFDAHGDINTEATSPSANAHGMPVAALLGLCTSELNDVANVYLRPENVFWVGVRDLDEGEVELLKKIVLNENGGTLLSHVFTSDDVAENGMHSVMQRIHDTFRRNGVKHFHLSFDIDGMDPSLIPATGTKVADGISQSQLNDFIAAIHMMQSGNSPIEMCSMDFVEYNPLLDDEQQSTGTWCANTINKLLKQSVC